MMKRIAGVHPDWGITVVRLLIGASQSSAS